MCSRESDMKRLKNPPEILKLIKRFIKGKNFSEMDVMYDFFSKAPRNKDQTRILFDVGAHYGISMLKFARSGWKVYCFEPDDRNRTVLEKTILEHGLKNVVVDGRAVSDSGSKAKFYSSEISTGISSLIRFHSSHKEAKDVETITLSSFCSSNNISHIDFLKIDTEGNDLKVIEGLDIMHNRPTVILCEYEDAKTRLIGYSKEDLIRYLKTGGYRCLISEWYPVVEYGAKHRWKRLTDNITTVDDNSWGNIIATLPEYYPQLTYKMRKLLN
jgi:FkbM family methyltransferase